MSKYNQKPYTAEEKRKAIEQYSEKIQYSARYSSELNQPLMADLSSYFNPQMRNGNTGEIAVELLLCRS